MSGTAEWVSHMFMSDPADYAAALSRLSTDVRVVVEPDWPAT